MGFILILRQPINIAMSYCMNSLRLMTAIREYQRMAPTMLTNAVMESILWNNIPVALQQEVKELSVGNVQVLLQKLLCAE